MKRKVAIDPELEKKVSERIEKVLAAALQRATILTSLDRSSVLVEASGNLLDEACCEYAQLFFTTRCAECGRAWTPIPGSTAQICTVCDPQ